MKRTKTGTSKANMNTSFHTAILQYDGTVVARQKHRAAEIRANQLLAGLARDFRGLLDQHLPHVFDDTAKFREVLDDTRGIVLDWTQPAEFVALALFLVRGKPSVLAAFLTGAAAPLEKVGVDCVEGVLADFVKAAGLPHRPRLTEIPARPVMVLFRMAVADHECARLSVMATSIAAAFFEKMAAAEWAQTHGALN